MGELGGEARELGREARELGGEVRELGREAREMVGEARELGGEAKELGGEARVRFTMDLNQRVRRRRKIRVVCPCAKFGQIWTYGK